MIFDAVVLVAILISSIVAFLRGFIRELLTIVGVIGGILAAFFGAPFLLPLMNGWFGVSVENEEPARLFGFIPMDVVAMIASYGAIFVVVVLILSVLSYFLSTGAKAMGLGPVDRALGVVFGMLRAALLLSLLYLPVYMLTNTKERDKWSIFAGSKTRFYVEIGSEWIAGFIPEGTDKALDEKSEDAGKKIKGLQKDMKDMEALKGVMDKAKSAVAPAPDETSGYQHEQRKNLDTLIEKNQ